MSWYVLKSRDELMTAGFLRDAGYLAYVPCEIVERTICRRLVWTPRPLLPGYVFVECDETSLAAVRAIGASTDFVRYLTPQNVLAPLRMPANALVGVFLAEASGAFDHSRQPPPWEPKRGDAIHIAKGLWKGYLGSIVSVGKRKILVQLKGCKMQFRPGDLELVA